MVSIRERFKYFILTQTAHIVCLVDSNVFKVSRILEFLELMSVISFYSAVCSRLL